MQRKNFTDKVTMKLKKILTINNQKTIIVIIKKFFNNKQQVIYIC